MCVGRRERGQRKRTVLTTSYGENVVVVSATGQHEGTRNYRQPLRLRLPGKLTSSARINLNHYWSVLEDLVNSTPASRHSPDELDNAINENLLNELSEEQARSRFVPVVEESPFSPSKEGARFVPVVEESPFSPSKEGARIVPVVEGSPFSPSEEGKKMREGARLVPVVEGSMFSPSEEGVKTRECDTAELKVVKRKFWGVFSHDSPLKRKASKSIMEIVKKLAK